MIGGDGKVDVAKSAQFSKKALSASQFSRFLSKHPLAAAVEKLGERQILNQQSLSASTFSQAASSIYFTLRDFCFRSIINVLFQQNQEFHLIYVLRI